MYESRFMRFCNLVMMIVTTVCLITVTATFIWVMCAAWG